MSAPSLAERAKIATSETVDKHVRGSRSCRTSNEMMATSSDRERMPNLGKVILVGSGDETVLERRLCAAGGEVVIVKDGGAAFERARRELFNRAVLVARDSLINVTETIFNLRDINPSMEIIVVLDRGSRYSNRFLKQLLSHPIAGTQVLTRRQLQAQLHREG
ncbi:MAG: hypothetical protein Q8S00_02280 [Deltaproteobacteria bacterium]|nr:hypothetical protein [Deltaproteobacteria bacterium]